MSVPVLREYLGEPTDRWFDDTRLQELLDASDDNLYAAAAEGWRIKLGMYVEYYDVTVDRDDSFERSAVFRHCKDMVELYESKSPGDIVSVAMATDTTASTTDQPSEWTP